MDTDVSKGKDTTSEENTVEKTQQSSGTAEPSEVTETVTEEKPTEFKIEESAPVLYLEGRLAKLEGLMDKILQRIDIEDEAVKIPLKKNYNPDYLPKTGGKPMSMDELPPRKG